MIACVSPKYTVSHHCTRELLLADLLRKPIIPVVFDAVPWPPRGAMALVFSQLVYVDMKGNAVRAFCVRMLLLCSDACSFVFNILWWSQDQSLFFIRGRSLWEVFDTQTAVEVDTLFVTVFPQIN